MLLGQGNRTVQPDLACCGVVEHDDEIAQSRHRLVLLCWAPRRRSPVQVVPAF
jgi:hypothetical protein